MKRLAVALALVGPLVVATLQAQPVTPTPQMKQWEPLMGKWVPGGRAWPSRTTAGPSCTAPLPTRGRPARWRDGAGSRLFAVPVAPGDPPQFGPATVTNGYWVADLPFGRNYDISPDGSALLTLQRPRVPRELGIILNFDEVIRRKLAEVAGGGTGTGGGP